MGHVDIVTPWVAPPEASNDIAKWHDAELRIAGESLYNLVFAMLFAMVAAMGATFGAWRMARGREATAAA